jgi:hypothetical protein
MWSSEWSGASEGRVSAGADPPRSGNFSTVDPGEGEGKRDDGTSVAELAEHARTGQ